MPVIRAPNIGPTLETWEGVTPYAFACSAGNQTRSGRRFWDNYHLLVDLFQSGHTTLESLVSAAQPHWRLVDPEKRVSKGSLKCMVIRWLEGMAVPAELSPIMEMIELGLFEQPPGGFSDQEKGRWDFRRLKPFTADSRHFDAVSLITAVLEAHGSTDRGGKRTTCVVASFDRAQMTGERAKKMVEEVRELLVKRAWWNDSDKNEVSTSKGAIGRLLGHFMTSPNPRGAFTEPFSLPVMLSLNTLEVQDKNSSRGKHATRIIRDYVNALLAFSFADGQRQRNLPESPNRALCKERLLLLQKMFETAEVPEGKLLSTVLKRSDNSHAVRITNKGLSPSYLSDRVNILRTRIRDVLEMKKG